jgi:hypothetical protein
LQAGHLGLDTTLTCFIIPSKIAMKKAALRDISNLVAGGHARNSTPGRVVGTPGKSIAPPKPTTTTTLRMAVSASSPAAKSIPAKAHSVSKTTLTFPVIQHDETDEEIEHFPSALEPLPDIRGRDVITPELRAFMSEPHLDDLPSTWARESILILNLDEISDEELDLEWMTADAIAAHAEAALDLNRLEVSSDALLF